ncbi:hypothetical protein BASA83_005926 [Batrachochytrium salamandrivorans]|nr:hypothetical protein BASA83_005926 [Batrachochytrium salamandrivorans]
MGDALKAYLAKNYMAAPSSKSASAASRTGAGGSQRKAGSKKSSKDAFTPSHRRTAGTSSSSSSRLPSYSTTVIIDEEPDWGSSAIDSQPQKRPRFANAFSSSGRTGKDNDDDDDDDGDDGPMVAEVDDLRARFKAPSAGGWVTLQEGNQAEPSNQRTTTSPSPPPGPRQANSDNNDNDRPAARSRSRASPSPSPPPPSVAQGVSQAPLSNTTKRMADGTTAGLQTGDAIGRHYEEKDRQRKARLAEMSDKDLGRNAPTVYRDKLGKKVDPALQKAEMIAERRRKDAEDEARMQWGKGLVQKEEDEKLAKRIAQERDAPLAVYVDDQELNDEQKARDRWGDPMAFMTRADTGSGSKSSKHSRRRRREVYKGPTPAPNRYGIPPGYRWDGVNRSNGFEATYFQQKHSRSIMSEAAYKWSTEDM